MVVPIIFSTRAAIIVFLVYWNIPPPHTKFHQCNLSFEATTTTTALATNIHSSVITVGVEAFSLSTTVLHSYHHPHQHRHDGHENVPTIRRWRMQSQLQQYPKSQSQSDEKNSNIKQPETQHQGCSNCLENVLRRNTDYQFTQRLITLPIVPSRTKVILAEVYLSKRCVLAQICSIIIPSEQRQPPIQPKFLIQIVSSSSAFLHNDNVHHTANTTVVDIGQITTIWDDVDCAMLQNNNQTWNDSNSDFVQQYIQSNTDHIEYVLDRLHQTRRNQNGSTSKIAIQKLMKELDSCCPGQQVQQEVAAMVLQKIYKTGMNFQRIIDSSLLVPYLQFSTKTKSNDPKSVEHQFRNQVIAAYILANDAQMGGRLKRWPCLYVSTSSIDNGDDHDHETNSITIVNGGWFVTDQAVRTGTEARKFVDRAVGTTINDDMTNTQSSSAVKRKKTTPTLADERIYRRLECMAMGELINTMKPDTGRRTHQESMTAPGELELDVREVLRTMNLPINPDGAKQALIQTGYWSKDLSRQTNLARMIQPWSKPVLDAAKWYTDRRSDGTNEDDIRKRIDLTQLPCVCIDAMKASFRDDAIGVRLRSSTGRVLIPEASKWEILIHITDVSDIYSIFSQNNGENTSEFASAALNNNEQYRILRDAAARRGSSRYDLPLGPLHLLPPIVLQTLSFPTSKDYSTNTASCRCVTIWAYIDERNGQLVDSGIERTLIAPPIILTFDEASNLLDRKGTTTRSSTTESPNRQAAQAIIMVAERNLKLWDDYERQHNIVAQKREVRLATRERSSLQNLSTARQLNREQRDDGVDGFRRTRGHRVVDVALNLYTNVAMQLLQRIRAPIPRAMGADYSTRGGRVGTAPLRRYIDGQIQRQLLALLCHYGTPMTMEECQQVSIVANQANNSINNIRAIRNNVKSK